MSVRWPAEPALGGWYTNAEQQAIASVLAESMDWRIGFRAKAYERAFEDAFAAATGTAYAVAFNGGGTALDMVLECLNLRPGDEIVSCAINFVGTHVAVLRAGARLVLAEPDPTTLNLDPDYLAGAITARTRAILVTHMNGICADIDAITEIAAAHPHPDHGPPVVIEDAARACGATYKDRKAGALGWAGVFSFQSKKLMTTLGHGGMVTTNDPDLAARLTRLRAFGKNIELGTNAKMTKLQAAVGLVQLSRLQEMNTARIRIARHRTTHLMHSLSHLVGGIDDLVLPTEPAGHRHLYYRYGILLPTHWGPTTRDQIITRLRTPHGLGCVIADPPTYRTHPLIATHTAGQSCPIADQTADRLLCPSLHPLMSLSEDTQICQAITQALAAAEPTAR